MTHVRVSEFTGQFRLIGDWLLREAEEEFDKRDFALASDKSWGAAAQYLKALATQRGWGCDTDDHLAIVADKLAAESGNKEIGTLFDVAHSLYASRYYAKGYHAIWSEDSVRHRMDVVRRFVDILAAMLPPEQSPREVEYSEDGMTYVRVSELAKEFRITGDWLLEEAESEFDKGDFVQASEKSWGATAQHLKALATERGWGHGTHGHFGMIADNLASETGVAEIRRLYSLAESLHANYYQSHRSEEAVREGMDDVRTLVNILAAIPPPETPPRHGYVLARPFVRTRDGNP